MIFAPMIPPPMTRKSHIWIFYYILIILIYDNWKNEVLLFGFDKINKLQCFFYFFYTVYIGTNFFISIYILYITIYIIFYHPLSLRMSSLDQLCDLKIRCVLSTERLTEHNEFLYRRINGIASLSKDLIDTQFCEKCYLLSLKLLC